MMHSFRIHERLRGVADRSRFPVESDGSGVLLGFLGAPDTQVCVRKRREACVTGPFPAFDAFAVLAGIQASERPVDLVELVGGLRVQVVPHLRQTDRAHGAHLGYASDRTQRGREREEGTLARVTKLRWTTQAVDDLEAIRTFIAKDSQPYAELAVARLLEAVDRLEDFPVRVESRPSSPTLTFGRSSSARHCPSSLWGGQL